MSGDARPAGQGPVPGRPPLLEIRDLHVSHGRVEAVRGISLSVPKGGIVTLMGPNGAGKSSTLGAIAGLLQPAGGKVILEGRELRRLPSHRAVAEGIVLVPEGRGILGRMSVEENLLLAAESRPAAVPPRDRRPLIDDQYRRFPVLGERRRSLAGSLSGGEQQMLAIARALAMRPRILLLDEPSMGLAPLLVQRIFEIVEAIHHEGTTILLVEQNARMALDVSDHAYVLERGCIVLEGPARELSADPRVQAAYLGGEVSSG